MAFRLAANEEPIPGYRLIERIGRGGFGEVWKCEAPGGLLKAIKFVFGNLDDLDDENTRAAEQEKKALERVKTIRHPYILSLERYDIIDGQLMIVMELADRNLWDRFRECRGLGLPGVPREELLKYMDEAAEALDLMNNHYHVQHLDVKPQNLFLVFNHVKVADFGLAKMFEGVRGTITGGVTPVYAAPETFEGHVFRYTDQYSLAIVCQELLTGTRPFNGSNTKQLLMQHLNGVPDLDSLPPADRPVIARGLEKRPDQRWPSCTDMVRALRAAGAYAPSPLPAGPVYAPADSVTVTRPGFLPDSGRMPRSGLAAITDRMPAAVVTPPPPGSDRSTPPPPSRPRSGPMGVSPRPASPTGFGPLITPKLVTPQGVSAAAGLADPPPPPPAHPAPVQTARMSEAGLAGPERTGDGALVPAVFVAVGATGRNALRAFQDLVADRFGGLEKVPHLRFVYLDTDAGAGDGDDANFVACRLNRPHHYLNRDGAVPVEPWLPPGVLYSLPRNPGPAAGVRAFGRLALLDNYKAVAGRVRCHVEAFLTDDVVEAAARRTGLGIRSNRVRAYVLAGLGGGTGGGMFLDLAFVVKNELRKIGYGSPDVRGILFVPPADKTNAKGAGLANTYAGLTELAHFHAGKNRYTVRFDPREPAVTEGAGPFNRCAVVQLPRREDPKKQKATADVVARGLFLELLTPAGRVVDDVRDEAARLNKAGTPVVQTFGLTRLTWPRRELLGVAAGRLAAEMIARWTGKDSAHLAEPIQTWIDDQWGKRGLELEAVVGRFEQVVTDHLREDPDLVFDAFVDPLAARAGGGVRPDPEAVVSVLDQILKVVGKPDAENDRPGSLHPLLVERGQVLAAEAEGHLSALTVSFIEQTQYRMPGADEALTQLKARLDRTVDGLAAVRDGLSREVTESYCRLFPLIGGLTGTPGLPGSAVRKAAELVDVLRTYPRKRLKLLVLNATLTVYRHMLGAIPEYFREVNTCRGRLAEIARALADAEPDAKRPRPDHYILPDDCKTLTAAADKFLAAVPGLDLIALDQAVQRDVLKKFRGVVNVCLKPEHGPAFRKLITDHARECLDRLLPDADPAAEFFRARGDGQAAADFLVKVFEDAAPDLTSLSGKPQTEATILAYPPGETGDQFRQRAEDALPGVGFIPAPLDDDIVFYREYPLLPLAGLPQLGEHAKQAYAAAAGPLHARADVNWQTG